MFNVSICLSVHRLWVVILYIYSIYILGTVVQVLSNSDLLCHSQSLDINCCTNLKSNCFQWIPLQSLIQNIFVYIQVQMSYLYDWGCSVHIEKLFLMKMISESSLFWEDSARTWWQGVQFSHTPVLTFTQRSRCNYKTVIMSSYAAHFLVVLYSISKLRVYFSNLRWS